MEDHYPSASEKQDERDLTSQAITPQMADGSSGLQAIISRVRERYAKRILPRPVDSICEKCGQHFFPVWDYSRQGWEYPGMAEEGLCTRCKRIRYRREHIEVYLKRAGVPLRYLHCSFENFRVTTQNRRVYEICRDYVGNPAHSLYLYGTCGTGKTHLAVAITRELLVQGKQVVFVAAPIVLFEIVRPFTGQAGENVFTRLTSYEYLVVEDLGAVKLTERANQILNYIICKRAEYLKQTIITSNFSLDEIAGESGPRLPSRLVEMGKILRLLGPDYRVKRARLRVVGSQNRCFTQNT